MIFMIYVSSATHLFSKSELITLLAKSRENNMKLNITGMLLYKDGNFMQVLEGKEETVRSLYIKIASDPRHQGIITLLEGPLEERQFPDWSMGFSDLTEEEALSIPGYSKFLKTPLTEKEFSSNPSRCQELLLLFKKNMR